MVHHQYLVIIDRKRPRAAENSSFTLFQLTASTFWDRTSKRSSFVRNLSHTWDDFRRYQISLSVHSKGTSLERPRIRGWPRYVKSYFQRYLYRFTFCAPDSQNRQPVRTCNNWKRGSPLGLIDGLLAGETGLSFRHDPTLQGKYWTCCLP